MRRQKKGDQLEVLHVARFTISTIHRSQVQSHGNRPLRLCHHVLGPLVTGLDAASLLAFIAHNPRPPSPATRATFKPACHVVQLQKTITTQTYLRRRYIWYRIARSLPPCLFDVVRNVTNQGVCWMIPARTPSSTTTAATPAATSGRNANTTQTLHPPRSPKRLSRSSSHAHVSQDRPDVPGVPSTNRSS